MKKYYSDFLLLLFDLFLVVFTYLFTPVLINNFTFTGVEFWKLLENMYLIIPLYMIIFFVFKLYTSIWKYASIVEVKNIFLAVFVSLLILLVIRQYIFFNYDLNEFFVSSVLLFFLLLAFRFGLRMIRIIIYSYSEISVNKARTLIIGAGSAGILVLNEIRRNYLINNNVVCFVDDNVKKVGKIIQGVKVVGTTNELGTIISQYKIEEIILAIPSASNADTRNLLNKCNQFNVKVRILPSIYKMIDKPITMDQIREIQIEDLLGREEIQIDSEGIRHFIENEVVLVTGGGGSIGSELCRQLVKHKPKQLIIFDIYENTTYDIQNELIRNFQQNNQTDISLEVVIGSVRDEARLIEVFEMYKPSIVFHAAAHKHVPLMEKSPKEAIKNNVFGTYNVAKTSDIYHVKKFVLISSDKAVNPTNIMGATKRFAEKIIQAFDHVSETQYSAVRFGNVLGSNGSVIPLFKKQILEGGPVTVTHKDIIRYFMTIPEAVQLVLQAGAFAKGGEIFVLDMGEPVKILDLAEKMIRFSGYEPYSEINIQFTGLRPGEKLYEELLMADEGLIKTLNDKIFVSYVNGTTLDQINKDLNDLDLIIQNKDINMQEEFRKFVDSYKCTK